MKNTQDITGRDICIGDYIAYTTRQSSSMTTHIGRVESIELDPTELNNQYGDPFKLKVVSVSDRWINHHYELSAYKTTLISNATIVILSHVPDTIRNLVNEFRERSIK